MLRLSEHGRKTWCYLYRAHGSRRLRRLTFGTYPAVTLADARRLALENRRGVQIKGENPADVKAAWKQIQSFGEVAAWYLGEYATKRKRSWKEDRRILDKELLPAWRDRRASDVSRAEVRTLLRSIADRPAPVMANRVLALVSRVYNKALEEDIPGIVVHPALRLPKPGGDEQGRERVLSDAEIRELWTALEDIKRQKRRSNDDDGVAAISPMIARGLQVLLLTGQRPGEVFRMRWADVDLAANWWTLSESATKNRVTHRVPLTDRVMALLEESRGDAPKESPWVFAGIKGGSVALRAVKAGAELTRATKASGERLRYRRTPNAEGRKPECAESRTTATTRRTARRLAARVPTLRQAERRTPIAGSGHRPQPQASGPGRIRLSYPPCVRPLLSPRRS